MFALKWDGEMPYAGCHIDFDAMHLVFWSAEATSHANLADTSAWMGWRITWLRDNFERHLELVDMDIRLPMISQKVLQQQAVEHLRQNFSKDRTNPAIELAKRIGGVPGVATEEARGSVRDDAKMVVIDALEKRIPVGDDLVG